MGTPFDNAHLPEPSAYKRDEETPKVAGYMMIAFLLGMVSNLKDLLSSIRLNAPIFQ